MAASSVKPERTRLKPARGTALQCVRHLLTRGIAPLIAAAAVIVLVQHLVARPDLRGFQPAELGRVESAMWRSYYEGHWLRLGVQTLQVSCGQYHFSWWDSARIATHTATAAAYFRTRTDDPRCLPELERYYRIIERASPVRFDGNEAARLELAWWRERRQKVPTHDYARTIAKLSSVIYGIPEKDTLPASLLRAEAMAYRDARRDGKMTEADWNEVTRQLRAAYADLHDRLESRPGTAR